jgi:hypothetical protein
LESKALALGVFFGVQVANDLRETGKTEPETFDNVTVFWRNKKGVQTLVWIAGQTKVWTPSFQIELGNEKSFMVALMSPLYLNKSHLRTPESNENKQKK